VSRTRLLRQALRDLEEVADWISPDNPSRALTCVRELEDRCHLIAEQPRSGRLVPAFGPQIRRVAHGDDLIFYRMRPTGISVLRIVHAGRDLRRL
jgi:toxin ParE1/3/4